MRQTNRTSDFLKISLSDEHLLLNVLHADCAGVVTGVRGNGGLVKEDRSYKNTKDQQD